MSPVALDKPLKLNLGGRDTSIPGFLTVDIDERPGVDVVADISDLSAFGDGEISEIYASHVLEHFPHAQTISVLKEWRRVLSAGGKANISVPDFDVLVKLYGRFGLTQFLIDLGWGGQEYDKAYHYAPFNFPRLAALLADAGFSDVKKIHEMPYGLGDCASRVDSWTHTPISLNVEATS